MPLKTDRALGGQSELERLRALLRAERSRTEQLSETISSLKQDKELLQHELTKKAELICDFLQDQLRPEKRRPHSSNQMEPGSSHMAFPDDAAGFDSPALFDSFEEVELHPLERHRTLKSKRSRDGENTRVRMKNVVGVIARYMAALQEFRRSVSMKVAFDRVGVDRNTISRTAAIAELSLAAPEVFHALAPWDEKEETLAHYAHRCRQAMDDNIKAKIKTMKAKGDLLPIVSK
ncbi:coiled-coil domain-containing protein 106-like [Centroberyx affinis]|uniref:coiled-coil domain-containing protein 106-like n=1 Tax=Centroberyx affinis TaxID=166261 RepID=UPI003A5BCAB1